MAKGKSIKTLSLMAILSIAFTGSMAEVANAAPEDEPSKTATIAQVEENAPNDSNNDSSDADGNTESDEDNPDGAGVDALKAENIIEEIKIGISTLKDSPEEKDLPLRIAEAIMEYENAVAAQQLSMENAREAEIRLAEARVDLKKKEKEHLEAELKLEDSRRKKAATASASYIKGASNGLINLSDALRIIESEEGGKQSSIKAKTYLNTISGIRTAEVEDSDDKKEKARLAKEEQDRAVAEAQRLEEESLKAADNSELSTKIQKEKLIILKDLVQQSINEKDERISMEKRLAEIEEQVRVAKEAARLEAARLTIEDINNLTMATPTQQMTEEEKEIFMKEVEAEGILCPETTPPGTYSNGMLPSYALCSINTGSHKLRPEAARGYIAMAKAYKRDMGTDICITDSYRTYEAQVDVKRRKPKLAAKPGTSNHGWGMALDLCGGINKFGSKEHNWMRQNAPLFGWNHPSWARETGSKPEAWHWEYYLAGKK